MEKSRMPRDRAPLLWPGTHTMPFPSESEADYIKRHTEELEAQQDEIDVYAFIMNNAFSWTENKYPHLAKNDQLLIVFPRIKRMFRRLKNPISDDDFEKSWVIFGKKYNNIDDVNALEYQKREEGEEEAKHDSVDDNITQAIPEGKKKKNKSKKKKTNIEVPVASDLGTKEGAKVQETTVAKDVERAKGSSSAANVSTTGDQTTLNRTSESSSSQPAPMSTVRRSGLPGMENTKPNLSPLDHGQYQDPSLEDKYFRLTQQVTRQEGMREMLKEKWFGRAEELTIIVGSLLEDCDREFGIGKELKKVYNEFVTSQITMKEAWEKLEGALKRYPDERWELWWREELPGTGGDESKVGEKVEDDDDLTK